MPDILADDPHLRPLHVSDKTIAVCEALEWVERARCRLYEKALYSFPICYYLCMSSISTTGWIPVSSEAGNGLTKVLPARGIGDALQLADIAMKVIQEQGYLQNAMLTVNRYECVVSLLNTELSEVLTPIEQVAGLIDQEVA